MTVNFNEDNQLKRVDTLKRHEEEELTKMLSAKYGLGYLDLSLQPINIDALRVIREDEARGAGLAVFNIVDKKIDVAVLSPNNPQTTGKIAEFKEKGLIPTVFMVSHESLNKVWDRYKDLSYSFETKSGALDISNDEIVELLKKVSSLEEIKKEIEEELPHLPYLGNHHRWSPCNQSVRRALGAGRKLRAIALQAGWRTYRRP
jgi:hypothetical protein